MNNEYVSKVLQRLISCSQEKCNKQCKKCKYYLPDEDKVVVLKYALNIIKQQQDIKKRFFNSGIEYAKNEFVRLIESEKSNIGELHKSKELDDLVYLQILGLQKAIELSDKIKV